MEEEAVSVEETEAEEEASVEEEEEEVSVETQWIKQKNPVELSPEELTQKLLSMIAIK